jgi:hypothetical protein
MRPNNRVKPPAGGTRSCQGVAPPAAAYAGRWADSVTGE